MSIWLDRSNSEALAASDASALAPPDLPISVTCWVYVDAQPGAGETHTVWWFGRDGMDSQFLKLAFQADGQSDIKFQATFRASNNTAIATAPGFATGTWHCVSVVVEETTSPDEYRLRLYADDASAEEGTTTASGGAVDDYDMFALGRSSGATKTDYASCRIEQVAAWQGDPSNPVLSASDNATMFNGRVPPRDAKTELDIGREPDLAYWILAAHARSGLRVRNEGEARVGYGELWNEVNDNANQEIRTNVPPPRWSAKTPIFRWKDTGKNQPIEDRPRKAPRSRLQPRFVFYQEPDRYSVAFKDPITGEVKSPVWDHPNFEHLGQTQFHNAGAQRHMPSATNEPRSDLAVVAASMADWLAFQGFAAGTGSEGGGQYEGSLYLRGIARGGIEKRGPGPEDDTLLGWDLPEDHPDNPFGENGEYLGIPLLQHPFDHIDQVTSGDEVADLWNVWYRNNGLALCREWSEHFWQALKEELDERGLCYPARLHWDYEHQPDWNSAMHASKPIGNWAQMIADPRFDDDDHPVYVDTQNNERHLKWVDDTRTSDPLNPILEPIPDQSPWGTNIEATNWLGGWVIAMRNSGLYKGVIEPALAADRFPQTKWSNYNDFFANHPDYTYPRRGPSSGIDAFSFNTPAEVTAIHADFSSPLLYSALQNGFFMREDLTFQYGATPSSVARGTMKARIDACVNARGALPVVPWFGSPLQLASDPTYLITFEDRIDMMSYAWQRGVDEFIMFVFGAADSWDQTWYLCNRLLDWVHMLPQSAQGERVARSNRLGRRQ